jgi:isoquinoline 1-oxidoreductase subunit beta
MTAATDHERDGDLSRRGFLALFGGVLTLGFQVGGCTSTQAKIIRHANQTGELSPNMYIAVKRDGRIGLIINKCEFGQGVTAAYSTLVAEELDVPVESVDFAFADSHPEYKTSFFIHQTGGSTSTHEAYLPVRQAAATAREMLASAAAEEWGVSRSECTTDGGAVHHKASGRRASYGELTLKAAHQSVPSEPRLKEKSQFKLIGKRNHRVDARAKVTGTARFGIDVVVPNMVKAVVIHGPVYGAEPKSVKADAAKKMPGVIDVFPFRAGVAVVAEKYWQALAASREVEVTWTAGDAAGLDSDKLRQGVHAYTKDGASVRDDGNVEKAMSKAPVKLEAVYDAPFLAHATMEPQNCTVKIDGSKAEVWAPCQSPTVLQAYVANALGIGQDDVLVHTTYVGGGFGRRFFGDWAAQAATIAKHVNRPVQLIWTRESDMTQGFYRPQAVARLKGSVGADGKPTGLAIHILAQPVLLDTGTMLGAAMPAVPKPVQNVAIRSMFGMIGSNSLPDVLATEGLRDTPYDVDSLRVEFTPVRTQLPVCSWRSVGHSINGFVVESFLDELARMSKQDPLELRRKMLPPKTKEQKRARHVLETVCEIAKWGGPKQAGIGRGLARHMSFGSDVAEIAEVELVGNRIRVKRVFAAVDCGIVINPDIVRAQVEGAIIMGIGAALDQEITLKEGIVQQRNYDTFPLLRMHECPEIVVHIIDSNEDPTGIGEPGLPPLAAAVANAIFDLTNVRLRRMPFQKAWDEVHR